MPNRFAVVLVEQAALELRAIFGGSLQTPEGLPPYVLCKAVNPAGPYFHMTLDQEYEGKPIQIEVQIPHAYVRGVVNAPDLRPLGFI